MSSSFFVCALNENFTTNCFKKQNTPVSHRKQLMLFQLLLLVSSCQLPLLCVCFFDCCRWRKHKKHIVKPGANPTKYFKSYYGNFKINSSRKLASVWRLTERLNYSAKDTMEPADRSTRTDSSSSMSVCAYRE